VRSDLEPGGITVRRDYEITVTVYQIPDLSPPAVIQREAASVATKRGLCKLSP